MAKKSIAGDLLPIAEQIWDMKYRLKTSTGEVVDATPGDTWRRVAEAVAAVELEPARKSWVRAFQKALGEQVFLPAGRVLAGAGTARKVTLFNCFVMGRIDDDMSSIFENLKQAALTMQQGGGIGHDFSTLRPRGAPVASIGADASGPLSFMDVWDAMCRTIMSAGSRRGAMMGTMRCDHPDIEAFIAAKSDPARLRMFNLSVLVSDAFIGAVQADADWDLVFAGKTYRSVRARDLWHRIMQATYDYAEPGVIFVDRINAQNNLAYCETINATNPCGEQPLPAYGACLLGSINLARLVEQPFSIAARLDEDKLSELTRLAVRFLDNVIDISGYPLAQQREEALAKRRIGLGITGLADALIMCGLHYDSDEARRVAASWMARIEREAYLASAGLAAEKGAFPLCDKEQLLAAPSIAALDADVQAAIARDGLRNGLLTSIAPTGTISLLAGNVSSGIEPVFDFDYERRVLQPDGSTRQEQVEDYAVHLFRQMNGRKAALPGVFVRAGDMPPAAHLAMQGALQRHVDSAISKTINCPAEISFDAFESIYLQAYELGLKGCTTYRPNAVTGAVLAHAGLSPQTGEADAHEVAVNEMAGNVAAGNEAAGNEAAADRAPTKRVAARAARLEDRAVGSPVSGAPADRAPTDLPDAADRGAEADIVYMARPLERDAILPGFTYKLKWPHSDHAIYVTINDIVHGGRRRPFEIFINSKNMEHYAWTVALTRMISAVFRRGGDVSFVVEELKAVFDPRGGYWAQGRYVPSLLAAIGEVIEQHMLSTGFLRDGEEAISDAPARQATGQTAGQTTRQTTRQAIEDDRGTGGGNERPVEVVAKGVPKGEAPARPHHGPSSGHSAAAGAVVWAGSAHSDAGTRNAPGAIAAETHSDNARAGGVLPGEIIRALGGRRRFCQRCGSPDMQHREGCEICLTCGHSSCG